MFSFANVGIIASKNSGNGPSPIPPGAIQTESNSFWSITAKANFTDQSLGLYPDGGILRTLASAYTPPPFILATIVLKSPTGWQIGYRPTKFGIKVSSEARTYAPPISLPNGSITIKQRFNVTVYNNPTININDNGFTLEDNITLTNDLLEFSVVISHPSPQQQTSLLNIEYLWFE
jgi:hypothetical protein